jgi:hypothetical protein
LVHEIPVHLLHLRFIGIPFDQLFNLEPGLIHVFLVDVEDKQGIQQIKVAGIQL